MSDDTGDRDIPQLSPEEKLSMLLFGEGDSQSAEEAKQIASGLPIDDLRKRAEENEHKRTEKFRDHFEFIAIISLYIIWICLVIIGLTWIYHIVAPACWPRLPAEQVKQLQGLVTGGILAGLAGGHIKKRLSI